MNGFTAPIPLYRQNKAIHDAVSAARAGNGGGLAEVPGAISVRGAESVSKTLSPSDAYALNIAVNAAVKSISQNISKAKVRLFTRDGDEVFGGPAFKLLARPNREQHTSKFVSDLVTYYNFQGEMAAIKSFDGNGNLVELRTIHPGRLEVWPNTGLYKSRSDISMWRYTWHDGMYSDIPDAALVFSSMLNPSDPVRGLPPTVTGTVEIGTLHWGGHYNLSRFQNGGIPQHLVILPEGTPRKEREDFERRYLAQYSRYNHNSHKVMVVSGGDVKVEDLEKSAREGDYINLMQKCVERISMLYRVPAIEIGLYDKSRFDTAAEERALYLESTLMPQCEMLEAVIQHQIIEPHFRFETGEGRRRGKMSKAMEARFDRQREETDSGLVVVVDTDSLPIASKVKIAQAKHIAEFRQATATSPRFATDYFGIEVNEERPEREDIYILATERNITSPEKNPEAVAARMKADAEKQKPKEEPKAPNPESPLKPDKSLVESAHQYLRRLRKLSLQSSDVKSAWSLAEADALANGVTVKSYVRVIRHHVRPLIEAGDSDGIRAYFNAIDARHLVAAHKE